MKPGHFYNVRVIAVGTNNFQAGSGVIRLRTYGRDGRPQLANGRVPSNLSIEDQQNGALADSSDESAAIRTQPAGIETAVVPEGPTPMSRELSTTNSGQRRNTGGRKHSPSSAAADQAALAALLAKQPEETMQKLTERFESIRRETEELNEQGAKDMEENKRQINELTKEKEQKKQSLKEREEASEKLRKEVNYSERSNRQAQNRKSQAEKSLREKQAERSKMQDDMARWSKEIEDMKTQRENWESGRTKMAEEKEVKVDELRAATYQQQSALEKLEDEIRIKGLRLKELEEERKNLPGAQDGEDAIAYDTVSAQSDRDYEFMYEERRKILVEKSNQLRTLQAQMQELQAQFTVIQARTQHNPMMYQGNSSGVDFDPSGGQSKAKSRRSRHRKSRTNTMSSPGYSVAEPQFPGVGAYNSTMSPSFAPGPYFDLSTNDIAMVPLSEHMSGMTDADIRSFTAGAPLSPTATSLLPSNIFADDDPSSPGSDSGSFGPPLPPATYEQDPQSPASSSRSPSLLSSPRNSSHNLAMYGVSDREYELDRRSLTSPRGNFGVIGSSNGSDQAPLHRGFGNVKDMFTRARGKTMQGDGPALGSLKHGQSQSFPRSTEEPELTTNRPRRISFSTSWNIPSFLTRGSAGEVRDGNAPAPARNIEARRRRGFNMFGSSIDDPSASFSERDPSSPRPVSIASSDLPRPSTDSAPFGWGPAVDGNMTNRASPLATNWSINAPQTWSRNPSRRPSIQHGSSTALASGLVSDDDDILLPSDLAGQSSPTPIGVIGTRPPSSHKPITPKLNPAAPDFKTILSTVNPFASKAEKGKGKSRDRTTEGVAPDSFSQGVNTYSPTESRHDTHSIHTQHSMAESQESLERITSSNAPSEPTLSASLKESSFASKLLRKGSSSKFSLSSIRNKDSSFFGNKKGGSSVATSDSAPREGSFDEFVEDDLRRNMNSMTSSPMLGSGEWKGKDKDKDSGTPKEGRINWSRFSIKGKKGRESLDVDRSEAETTGTEDDDF